VPPWVPASVRREEALAGDPLGGIDRDEIDIAIEAAVLKSIVQNEQIPEVPLFGEQTGCVSIGAHNNGNAGCALRNQPGLVSRHVPGDKGPLARAHDKRSGTSAFIAAGQHHRTEPFVT
jgi:hypothetical protein